MSKVEKMVLGILVSFAIGITLKITGALAPIHEVGHVLAGMLQGSRGRIVAWNAASIEHKTNLVVVAGHYFELIVYFALVMAFKVKRVRLATFALGAQLTNIGQAMRSTDFLVDLVAMNGTDFLGDVMVLWLIINIAFLTWSAIALTMEIQKGVRLLNASERSHKRQDAFNTPSEETFFAIRREIDLMAHRRAGKKL